MPKVTMEMKESIDPNAFDGFIEMVADTLLASEPPQVQQPAKSFAQKRISSSKEDEVPLDKRIIKPLAAKPQSPSRQQVIDENTSGLMVNPADTMSYNAASIMEHMDKWAANPFNVDLSCLKIPSKVIDAPSQLLEELNNIIADLNAATYERNEAEKKINLVFDEQETHKLGEVLLECNKAIKFLREKKITWHARLTDVVFKLSQEHNEEVTGYVSLKKRKAMEEIAGQPSQKKIVVAMENSDRHLIVVSTGDVPLGQSAPDKNVGNEDVPPEPWAQEAKEKVVPPDPSAPEKNALPSPVKEKVDEVPCKSNLEEGEITPPEAISHSKKDDDVMLTNSPQSVPKENANQSEQINIDPDSQSQLPPIDENIVAPDDKEAPDNEDKEIARPNLKEKYPVFHSNQGPRGPIYHEALHKFKLDFFKKSPYEEERTAASPHFWTTEQATYYCRVMCRKDMIFEHGILDNELMKELGCFKDVLNTIEELQLTGILIFSHGWKKELTYQFFATLYVTGDKLDINTWVMEWMMGDRKITCTAESFLRHFNFSRFKGNYLELRMHVAPDITDEQLHLLMDPDKVGDAASREPKDDDLEFNSKTFYYIVCKSLCPTVRANSNGQIKGVL